MNEDATQNREIVNKFFKSKKKISLNNKCADCSKMSPIWVTITYGLYICSDCAAKHRQMGIVKSKVKSTLLDTWTLGELRRMHISGNREAYKLGDEKDLNIKYGDVDWYKELLDKKVLESRETKGVDFLKEEDFKKEIRRECTIVEAVPLPSFGDTVCVSKTVTKAEESIVEKNADEILVIKKRGKPSLSKNKEYEISDGANTRLGFMNKK